jgi:hypothetical protein
MGDVLDLDVEKFNPEITRKQYEERGYTTEMTNSLVAIDTLLYNKPAEELRAAVKKRRDAKTG